MTLGEQCGLNYVTNFYLQPHEEGNIVCFTLFSYSFSSSSLSSLASFISWILWHTNLRKLKPLHVINFPKQTEKIQLICKRLSLPWFDFVKTYVLWLPRAKLSGLFSIEHWSIILLERVGQHHSYKRRKRLEMQRLTKVNDFDDTYAKKVWTQIKTIL